MRQLQLRIRHADVDRALEILRAHGADAPHVLPEASGGPPGPDDGKAALLLVQLPNDAVGAAVEELDRETALVDLVLVPHGVLPLHPPLGEVHERIRDVSRVSTLELILGSLQSVGSWKGLVLYSCVAGIIGAYGVAFDVAYLLVAAMLVNPMGAPALVSVIGMTVGDARMFARGGGRFLVSLSIQATAALLFGYLYALQVSTPMMEQITSLSVWAVVLAAAAGAAGALALVNADRDSLVSGTAAGFMVAAALAPPAAVLGLSVALQRWDYTQVMAFLLVLQFAAIGAGGWLSLTIYGVKPGEFSARRGSPARRTAMLVGVLLATAGLVFLQTTREPGWIRGDLSREALHAVRDAVAEVPGVRLLQSEAEFTRPDVLERDEALLVRVTVQGGPEGSASATAEAVRRAVERHVMERMSGVVPFVDVRMLSAPAMGITEAPAAGVPP